MNQRKKHRLKKAVVTIGTLLAVTTVLIGLAGPAGAASNSTSSHTKMAAKPDKAAFEAFRQCMAGNGVTLPKPPAKSDRPPRLDKADGKMPHPKGDRPQVPPGLAAKDPTVAKALKACADLRVPPPPGGPHAAGSHGIHHHGPPPDGSPGKAQVPPASDS